MPRDRRRDDGEAKTIRDFQGLEIHVDRPAGTVAEGVAPDGTPYRWVYAVDYGYFPRVQASDGDSLDAFVGPADAAPTAFVVTQLKNGSVDQPKVMLGFTSAKEAEDVFLAHRAPEMIGGIGSLAVESLRAQIEAAVGSDAPIQLKLDDQAADAAPASPPPSERNDTGSTRAAEQSMETQHVRKFATIVRHVAALSLAAGGLEPAARDALVAMLSSDAASEARDAGGGEAVSRPDGMRVRQVRLRAVREAEREADFVASTETVDSYGEVIRQNWRLERFQRNPVILFAHNSHALPIGRGTNVRVEGGALLITVKFATAKANPFAEFCWQSVLEDMLRGGSVGFMPHKVSCEDIGGCMRTVCDDNELYEFTVCPVPSNPDGLVRVEERLAKTFGRGAESAVVTPPNVAAQPAARSGHEGTMKTTTKKLTPDEMAEMRRRGALTYDCQCGTQCSIEMPDLDTAEKAAEARSRDAEQRAATVETTLTDLREKASKSEAELANEKKRGDDLQRKLCGLELEPLVGKQITPAERDDYVEIALENPTRYERMVNSARSRAPQQDLTQRADLGQGEALVAGASASGPDTAIAIINRAAEKHVPPAFAIPTSGPAVQPTSSGLIGAVQRQLS